MRFGCHVSIATPDLSWCRIAGFGPFIHVFELFLAVQNSSIGDLVTHSLTHSVTESRTFTFDIKERPERLVTFQTFYQRDEET